MRDFEKLESSAAYEAEAPLRLLVAEDDPVQRLLLTERLGAAGYLVEQAADGIHALERLRGGGIDLLVADWEMPGLTGPQLCRELRSERFPEYVYVLLLTGHDSATHLVDGFDAGADDYLRKSAPPLELLARLAAAARIVRLERSLRAARARIEILSVQDPLLPLFNRRYLKEALARELTRARRYQHCVSVVMSDLDYFKRINDTHGHRVGDEVLIAYAYLMAKGLRQSDFAARYGGEEFVIVLPETDATGAGALAERLRAALADTPVATSAGPLPVTASFGVATFGPLSGSETPANALLAAADGALYRSKHAGRNRVTSV